VPIIIIAKWLPSAPIFRMICWTYYHRTISLWYSHNVFTTSFTVIGGSKLLAVHTNLSPLGTYQCINALCTMHYAPWLAKKYNSFVIVTVVETVFVPHKTLILTRRLIRDGHQLKSWSYYDGLVRLFVSNSRGSYNFMG